METLRLILCALALSLPLASFVVGHLRSPASFEFSATRVPDRIGAHRAQEDSPLAPDVLEMLQPESYVMRRYRSPEGRSIWVYLAAYSGTGSTGAHDPTVCYPANGWDLSRLDSVDIAVEGGDDTLKARLLLATQRGQEELALYWFQPVGRWPREAPWEHLLRVYDRFAGRPQYVFVRLSTSLPRGERLPSDELVRLARELAPWLRRELDPRSSRDS